MRQKNIFGSEDVFIEKYFQNPRHIESTECYQNGTNTMHLGRRRLHNTKKTSKTSRGNSQS